MKLSDYIYLGLNVVQDATFESFCKISDKPPQGAYLLYIEKNFSNSLSILGQIDKVTAIITTEELYPTYSNLPIGIALCDYPKFVFLQIFNATSSNTYNFDSIIPPNCLIDANAYISPKGVRLGDNVRIESGVVVYPGVEIGENSIIKRGAIIGNDDFENCTNSDNTIVTTVHQGSLIIGNNVTIGEYCIIDKALFSWDVTRVGNYSYIGRGSDIAHGCKIGCHSILISYVRVLGNTRIGNYVKIGVGAILSNRINVGSKTVVSLGSVVNKDVEEGTHVTGYLAIPHEEYIAFIKFITNKNNMS